MVTATAVVGVAYATATVAQQKDEDDDPAHIATAEAIVIHNEYLRKFTCDFRRSFQGIPKPQKCYNKTFLIVSCLAQDGRIADAFNRQ